MKPATRHPGALVTLFALLWPLLFAITAWADEPAEAFEFDDAPLEEPLEHPSWFKESFLDLPEDLNEAVTAGKSGVIIYFGQRRCPYCQKLLEVNFGQQDIADYTQRHFDVIPVDIWGIDELTDMDGATLTEREFALRKKSNFTPTLIFYTDGVDETLRLTGYHPPYTFRAALEYVAGGHYRNEPFKAYLDRGDGALTFSEGELNEADFFSPPPHALDRSRLPGETPLAVFFERGNCHACDILHAQPLQKRSILSLLEGFETVQLDINADTPVITPDGKRTTARQWADSLGLFYSPSILFFDESGREIMRVDSVVQFYRLRNILDYIGSRGYLSEASYQRWRTRSSR
ncbi:MAG: thioredoxin fold domain-containing protein [Sedimenticola sp.]